MTGFRLFWLAVRQVFHETTGAMFFFFAAVGVLCAWRQWHNPVARWVVGLGIGYALMMAAFGVSAFRDARRVRQANHR
jgi:hypothetical protein